MRTEPTVLGSKRYVNTIAENVLKKKLDDALQCPKICLQSDFMALSIEAGYPVLTLDFGSGPKRIINNKRYVSDNVWRQLIVDRLIFYD